jgi:hypothetical protein
VNDILGDLRADILAYVSPRSAQTATGASQVYGCIAQAVFRLRGEPVTDPRIGWPALVGNGIHAQLAAIRAAVRPGVICEQQFTFKNVPCTVDYIDPAQRLLLDYKTRNDADAIAVIRQDGPAPAQVAQIQLGMGAARAAGISVDRGGLVFLPRAGDSIDDAYVWGPVDYDEDAALEAAAWSADVDTLAADPGTDPRDHRGKPAFWCYQYCPYARACRGEPAPDPVLSDEVEPIAADYHHAARAEKAAKARMRELRPALLGLSGQAGAYKIITSGGRPKTTERVDVDSLIGWWKFANPGMPVPTVTEETVTTQRLTVRPVTQPEGGNQ